MSLPGVFLAVRGNHNCIVTNLSQTGVLMAIGEPLNVGDEGYLRSGLIDHFMVVTRKDRGLNALEFDNPVSHEFVLEMRAFQDSQEERQKFELRETVCNWTQGANRGRI